MSLRREQAMIRVRTILVDLESQSEGRAMSWDGEKITYGKPDSHVLSSTGTSDFETVLRTLEVWCSEAEKRVLRGRPKPDTKPEELRYRILNDYTGRNSEKVADDEGCTQKYVEDLRAAHGLTRRHGTPNRKKAA